MAKKLIFTLSLEAPLAEAIKDQAKVSGVEKPSEYIQDWLKKLALDQKDIKRVILHIPQAAFASKETLEAWLKRRSADISSHYFG